MIVTRKTDLDGTPRAARGPGWTSHRMLVRTDGVGFSVTETRIDAGAVLELEYRNHIEAVHCVEGTGSVTDLATGQEHRIAPGTLYCLDRHDRHVLRAEADGPLRLVCTFAPALEGDETHDASGSYGRAD